MPRSLRVEFTKEHDSYLYKYIATYCPSKEGRSGRKIFQCLVANENETWPWSAHHTWQSWRERYVKNADHFDRLILNYQRKHNINPKEMQKRAADPVPIEMLQPGAKRAKLEEEEEEDPSSETRKEQGVAERRASPSPLRPSSISEHSCEPEEVPLREHPTGEPEFTDLRPSSPPRPKNDTNNEAPKEPFLDPPALQTQHGTIEFRSSSPSPNQPARPTDGKPGPRSVPPAVKRRIKKRRRASSEVFASEPSSPKRLPAAVDMVDAPVTDTVRSRAPQSTADSLYGQVSVYRKGDVPPVLPHEEDDGVEEEQVELELEDKARWPPRGRRAPKQRTASWPDAKIDSHHAFSQPQPLPELESVAIGEEREGEKSQHPFEHVSLPPGETLPDRRTVAALFSTKLRHDVTPRVENEQREDIFQNGASPVKRIVPTPPSAPPDLVLNSVSKVFDFIAPRASTRSPFRLDPPVANVRHPASRPQSRTTRERRSALHRRRKQATGREHENGRGRVHGQVPSVDLVTLSRSSTSTRSHSNSSTGPSVPTKPSRWSLPAFVHPTPWEIDGHEAAPSAPGSGSRSSFRWIASSPAYAGILGQNARPSSLAGVSAPRFMLNPSPVATKSNAADPYPDAIPSPTLLPINPHPFDVPLTASHGLASILAHMSTNHGLALDVVEAVYTRVRSLREADEVLKGMREAAEEFGETEIEKRTGGRREKRRGSGAGRGTRGKRRQGNGDRKEQKRTAPRYVVASEDGEGSEYSPPETSRAAMWKQQSESASYAEEEEERGQEGGEGEEGDWNSNEEEEGHDGGGEESENGLFDRRHDLSRVLLGNMEAHELERKMGRRQLHKDIVGRFI